MLSPRFKEIVRFGVTGLAATAVLYGSYLLLVRRMSAGAAYSCAYVCAFIVNYLLTTAFTFKVRRSVRNGLGFVGSNVLNYFVSMALLKIFLALGVPPEAAPVPVILLATVSNYLITRIVMKKL